ncbi:MAG: TraR/DksA C4-type zinc finger protein [Planctomycetaceae bacterium]|nr:TraR/DksA C4-type zinc finger protein [Planctomycetaceae bacterium]
MNTNELNHYREVLQNLTARLRPEVSAMTERAQTPSGGQAGGELTNAPMHLADMGTEEYLHGINSVLLENEEYIINEARAALERMDSDLYGTCEFCGTEIPAARLEAMPYARYCVTCAAAQQAGAPADFNAGRPRSPADTLAPEGDMNETRRPQRRSDFEPDPAPSAVRGDVHAVGTAGGGTAFGGLAGSNVGNGEPDVAELDEAMGSGELDAREARDVEAEETPKSGRAGGAVGGTPARKRAK